MNKPDYKVFAQDAKSGELVTFPNILRGWGITLEQYKGFPPMELFNSAGKRVDEWLMYLTQRGLAEWDGSVDYPKDALVQHSSVFYVALKVTKGEQPNTSQSAWKPLVDFLGVNNKLDKTAVVQSTGSSTTSVMSQKASTDTFQPKGNYADKSSTQTQVFNGATSATGSSSVTFRGNSVDLIVSNTVVLFKTKIGDVNNEIALPNNSGTLALAGESYTKSQSDGRYQPTGNYALAGTSYTKTESDAKYQLKGNYSLIGDSYTKNESDSKYQPKGNYADKSSTQTQVFNGATSATGSSSVTFRGNSVDLIVSNTVVLFKTKIGDANNEIALPNNSGTLALAGESYTKSQSDGRYQPTGNYVLKSELNDIELVPHPIPWSLSTAPAGYLICQGQTFNKTTYPKLATAYPSGKLPDLRGEFIRGSDADRGVDSGRVVLSTQSGNSLLSTNMLNNDSPVAKEYQQKVEWIGSSGTNNQGGYGIFQQIEGANGNETRPRNIAFLYIVRAA